MALAEQTVAPKSGRKGNLANLSRGNHHSKRVKLGSRVNRLIGKDLPKLVEEQVKLATQAESESVRAQVGQYLIDRVLGRPSSAPEDMAAAGATAAAIVQVLTGIARRPTDPVIDITPQDSTLPSNSLTTLDNPAAEQG